MSDSTTDSADQEMPATTMHVQRAVGGNLDSLGWLITRLSPLLVAQASYRLGRSLRAQIEPEDLVNEVWAIALPRLTELGERDGRLTPRLLKFLSSSMTFRISNMLRSRLRQGASGEPSEFEQLPAATSGVITRAVRRETNELVRDELDALDPADREVILLRGIEQHPSKAVATMLEISPAAVDKRYSRALARLRAKLKDSIFDELDDA